MNTWNLILAAAALLVFIHGVRVTFSADQEQKSAAGRRTMGCSYALLATAIWSVAFGSMLGDWWVGVRLAFGFVLLLIAAGALLRPAGAQLMKAAVGVLIGGLLVVPIAPDVWAQINPPAKEKLLERLAIRVDELQSQLRDTERLAEKMRRDQDRLAEAVRDREFTDYAALAADPGAVAKLRELAEVERLLARNETQGKALRVRLSELETAQRRLARRIEVEESAGNQLSGSQIETMLRDLELQQLDTTDPVTLDEYAEQDALRRLFERTAKGK